MTIFDILSTATSSKYSWIRLATVSASLLLATVGGKASAAVDCAARTANHAASAQCRAHHPHASVHGRSKAQKTVSAKPAVSLSDGDVLIPVSAVASKTIAAQPRATVAATVKLPDVARPASALLARVGHDAHVPGAWSGRGAPARNSAPQTVERPVAGGAVTAAAATPDNAATLHDLLRGNGGAAPVVPAPAAWTILLAGLLGLVALARYSPRIARVRSWAMATPASADRSRTRAKARGWAVDRVDPERYAAAQVSRSRQGHFVRSSAGARFGSDAL